MKKRIIFLYPGQGAQHVGMGLDLYQKYPLARERFEQADNVLGFSLSRMCFKGPEDKLSQDLNAQLAVYTISCILTDLLEQHGIVPESATGYSSGFYAAGYAAGCFDFSTGLEIVRRAGQILLEEGMKADGKMAVVFGLSLSEVKEICREIGDVDVAIVNTPRQTVISGSASSVQQALTVSINEGALDAYLLPAQTAYHSEFMKNGGLRFSKNLVLKKLYDPKIPVMSYRNMEWVNDKEAMARVMSAQLSDCVQWVDVVKKMGEQRNSVFFEVGPGNIIYRTVRWIDRTFEIISTSSRDGLIEAIEIYNHANFNR